MEFEADHISIRRIFPSQRLRRKKGKKTVTSKGSRGYYLKLDTNTEGWAV